ncbi:MAG: O-antigen ligase family protein [Thiobacillus sp.]|nr:O-antigen ligase family protein [Thiobacillus sp.]
MIKSTNQIPLILLFMIAAPLVGLAVALLPLTISMVFSMLLLLPIGGAVLLALPSVKSVPYRYFIGTLGLCLFLYFAWPKNVFIPIEALPVKHPQKILYIIFLVLWFAFLVKSGEMRRQFYVSFVNNRTIVWLWVSLVLWRFVTVFTSEEPLFSFFRFTDDFLTYYILLPVVMSMVRCGEDVRTIMNWLLAALVVTSLYAVPEVMFKRNLFESISTLDIVDPVQASLVTAAKFRGGIYRSQSAFDHPLTFSEFIVTILPWAIASFLVLRKKRWFIAMIIALAGGALVFTNSRSSLAASMIVLALLLFIAVLRNAKSGGRNPWPMIGAIFLFPLAIFTAVLFSGPMQEILKGRTNVEYGSSLARIQMLDQGLPLVAKEPLLGYGPGLGARTLGFANTYDIITLDNYYLAAALESGVPYLIILISLALAAFIKSLRLIGDQDPKRAWLYASIGTGLVAFWSVKAVLGTPHNFPLFYLFVGLACAASLPSNTSQPFK